MICMNCHCELPEDAEVCSHCGAVVRIRPEDRQRDEESLESLKKVALLMKGKRALPETNISEDTEPFEETEAEETSLSLEEPAQEEESAQEAEEPIQEADEPVQAAEEQAQAAEEPIQTEVSGETEGSPLETAWSVITSPVTNRFRSWKEDRDHNFRRLERSRSRRKRTNAEKGLVTLVILVLMAVCAVLYLLGQRKKARDPGNNIPQTQESVQQDAAGEAEAEGDGAGSENGAEGQDGTENSENGGNGTDSGTEDSEGRGT